MPRGKDLVGLGLHHLLTSAPCSFLRRVPWLGGEGSPSGLALSIYLFS